MLKQILSDMYIDPELLAELSEEQKQILFFKMRQEQIRRWKEREAAADKDSAPSLPAGGKSVRWKLGADNDVWVWVMGEHPSDKSYAAICEEIQAQRAKRLESEQGIGSPCLILNISQIDDDAVTKPVLGKHREMAGRQQGGKFSLTWDYFFVVSVRKSKAADEKRRSLAQHARDDYRRLSLQGIRREKQAEVSRGAGEQRRLRYPPLPPKPALLPPGIQRTVSNSTEESIIKWFREEQFPLRAGYERTTDTIAPWFHGILTSKKAEDLLSRAMPGSFLVRVSEKIKGYVLSYQSVQGCKHFLIDASGDSYSFLGVDQLQHSALADLVEYHKEEPITSLGKELLLYPCGQEDEEPDYLALFA
uniref:SH2 domain containing 4A n=1 Tax=Nothoprocta perdicaria TaxID=30464 RepID=A0A8C7A8T7_NOTPE